MASEVRTGDAAFSLSYSYDLNGNRLTKREGDWETRSDYDDGNRLMSVGEPLFLPQNGGVGNEQPTSEAGIYEYDANGNRVSVTAGEDATLYSWDAENRLRRMDFADGTHELYWYDDAGLRRRKVERDGSMLDMVWDAGNLLQVLAGNFEQLRFTSAGATMVSMRSVDGSGGIFSSHFYGFDHNANTRVLTDGAGTVSDTYVYSAFGEAKAATGATPNPHRFGGEVGYYDEGGGRNYVRARYLDTDTGSWLSEDPIGFKGSKWNLYGYAGNNPVTGLDSDGLRPMTREEVIGGLGGVPSGHGKGIYRINGHTYYGSSWVHDEKVLWQKEGVVSVFRKHGGTGLIESQDFDYKTRHNPYTDHFWVNNRWLSPGGFGNYAAGYAGNWALGLGGTALNHMFGAIFEKGSQMRKEERDDNWHKRSWFNFADAPLDSKLIDEGAHDSARYKAHLLRDLQKRAPVEYNLREW